MRAVAERELPVQVLVDRDPTAGECAPPLLPLDLQGEPREAHRVIPRYHLLVLQAEDAVEVCPPARDEGRALCRGRDAELPVELGDILLSEEAVGLLKRSDA